VRIPISMNRFGRVVLTLVGIPASSSYVEVDGDAVRVRLGWGFSASFRRDDIASIAPTSRRTISLGAHGWRGRWLVNGAWSPLATVTLRAPVRAWVMGVPVQLRELIVSVDDPDALRADLVGATTL
jgi:hypothetical protein